MFLVPTAETESAQETSIEWLITAKQAAEVLACLTGQHVPESSIAGMSEAGCFQRFSAVPVRYWFSDVFAYGERLHRAQRTVTQTLH
jgi:hypothetical protein